MPKSVNSTQNPSDKPYQQTTTKSESKDKSYLSTKGYLKTNSQDRQNLRASTIIPPILTPPDTDGSPYALTSLSPGSITTSTISSASHLNLSPVISPSTISVVDSPPSSHTPVVGVTSSNGLSSPITALSKLPVPHSSKGSTYSLPENLNLDKSKTDKEGTSSNTSVNSPKITIARKILKTSDDKLTNPTISGMNYYTFIIVNFN